MCGLRPLLFKIKEQAVPVSAREKLVEKFPRKLSSRYTFPVDIRVSFSPRVGSCVSKYRQVPCTRRPFAANYSSKLPEEQRNETVRGTDVENGSLYANASIDYAYMRLTIAMHASFANVANKLINCDFVDLPSPLAPHPPPFPLSSRRVANKHLQLRNSTFRRYQFLVPIIFRPCEINHMKLS